jgi:carboxypeptidase T
MLLLSEGVDMRIRNFAVAGLGLLLLAANVQSDKIHAKLQLRDKTQLQQLRDLEIDIAGVNLKTNEVGVVVTSDELNQLQKQFKVTKKNFLTVAPDDQYKNPQEIEEILKMYGTQYPDLTEVMSIGKTEQGRDIWAIRLTNKNNIAKLKKPTFYINGMHHAREVMSPEVPLDAIEYLLTNYGKDSKATHWLDQNEIWAVPMVNPDGNNVVWTDNVWWRKNVSNGYGVDINRNYPYMWGQCKGSSGNKGADDYRGPSAASENETQAIFELIKNIRPVASLSLHSYSELVLYPLSCSGQHAAHEEFFKRVGGNIANAIPMDGGGGYYTPGTPWELLYSVDGGDIDWLYSDFGVMPFVIEMNQEFQVDYNQYRDETVKKIRVAWMTLLDLLDGSGVRGKVRGEQEITVRNLNKNQNWKSYSYPTDKNGNFHIVLDPGVYEINGKRVVVKNKRVDLN